MRHIKWTLAGFFALCLFAIPALAAAPVLTHLKQGSANSADHLTMTAVTAAANTPLVASCEVRHVGATTCTVTDNSGGNVWSTPRICSDGAGHLVTISFSLNTSGLSSGTVTVTDPSGSTITIGGSVNSFSGGNTSSLAALEDSAVYNSGGSCATGSFVSPSTLPPTVTGGNSTQANDLLYGIIATGNVTYTEDGTWTAVSSMGNTNQQSHDAQYTNTGTSAKSWSPALGASGFWIMMYLGIAPPAAAASNKNLMFQAIP